MEVKKYKSMSFSEIMNQTFFIHKKHLGTSALYLFVFNIFSMMGLFVIAAVFAIIGFSFLGFNIANLMDIGTKGYIMLGVMGALLFFLVFTFALAKNSGVIFIAKNAYENKPIKISAVLSTTMKNIPKILTTSFAYVICLIPLFGITAGAVYLFISNLSFLSGVYSIVSMVVLGVGLLIIYAFFCSVFVFACHAVVFEQVQFFQAIKRSINLITKDYWRILGCNILAYLVIMAITYSIYLIVGLLGGIIALISFLLNLNEEVMTILIMLGDFVRVPVNLIVVLFVSPIGAIFTTLLYYNQRFKYEGYDLALILEEMEKIEDEKRG